MGDAASLRPCPTCDGPVAVDAKHRPFCSDRCRLVDLGRWLHEDYAVPDPTAPPPAPRPPAPRPPLPPEGSDP